MAAVNIDSGVMRINRNGGFRPQAAGGLLPCVARAAGQLGGCTSHEYRVVGLALHAGRSRRAQRQEILRAADGLAHAAEQLLQVSMALHEVDVVGIHHQQV